jgi:hypothetical protein
MGSSHRRRCRSRCRSRSRSRRRLSKRWRHRFGEHQLASITNLPKHSVQATIKRRVFILIRVPEAIPTKQCRVYINQREHINRGQFISNQTNRTTSASLR